MSCAKTWMDESIETFGELGCVSILTHRVIGTGVWSKIVIEE